MKINFSFAQKNYVSNGSFENQNFNTDWCQYLTGSNSTPESNTNLLNDWSYDVECVNMGTDYQYIGADIDDRDLTCQERKDLVLEYAIDRFPNLLPSEAFSSISSWKNSCCLTPDLLEGVASPEGSNHIKFGQMEPMQQELSHALNSNYKYVLKFWARKSDYQEGQLRFTVSSTHLDYKTSCEDYFSLNDDYVATFNMCLKAATDFSIFDFNRKSYYFDVTETWQEYELEFIAPSYNVNWVMFDPVFEDDLNCFGHFMFIDDIRLYEYGCEKECTRGKSPDLPTLLTTQVLTEENPWCLTDIQNITQLRVEMFGQDGSRFYQKSYFNENATFSDICWDGRDDDGNVMPNDAYLVKLYANNCCIEEMIGTPFFIYKDFTPSSFNYVNSFEHWSWVPMECCLNELVVENETLIGDLRYVAKEFILFKDIEVPETTKVYAQAPDVIIGGLNNGSHIKGDFHITSIGCAGSEITPCGFDRREGKPDSTIKPKPQLLPITFKKPAPKIVDLLHKSSCEVKIINSGE